MRTKSLLLAAAALAAGVLSSHAQGGTVYSANIVGYVNQTLSPGYTLVNNPLLNTDGTNGAANVFPSLQLLDSLLIWNGHTYVGYTYVGNLNATGWTDSNNNQVPQPTIPQGAGVFYQNNNSTETNTYVGTVVLTNSITLNPGYTLIGSTVPLSAPADSTNFSLPFQILDSVLLWNGSSYTGYTYVGNLNATGWTDSQNNQVVAPTINVGQGFFYQNNNSAEVWNQSVTVQ